MVGFFGLKSNDKLRDKCKELTAEGDRLVNLERFEEAARAYFEAAELIVGHKLKKMYATNRYEKAAECYSQIKSSLAFMCYKKVIEVYMKKRYIGKAIQACFEYGYKCEIVFGDENKRDEFYRIGDELRDKHKIPHLCAIEKFDKSKYGNGFNIGVVDLVKFDASEQKGGREPVLYASLCRECIDVYKNIYSHCFLKPINY